ncbi:MAG: hypothetical protein RMM58_00375 [Chloroflexota bacterium]|nr:hypothetical protein [Dehalococcoidia bacterium]MDW8252314.1 hypothetical protein [Chloroflexota bacterium]
MTDVEALAAHSPVRAAAKAVRGVRASYPAAALLLSLIAGWPLLHPEFLGGAPGALRSLERLLTLEATGAWPLWVDAEGPLPVVLAWALAKAGAGPLIAIKLVMAIAVVGSALTMYCIAADLWGRRGGLLAALLFVYAPTRLVDLYVRGAVAEALAWLSPPLLLWAGRRAILARSARSAGAAGAAAGGGVLFLLLTHLGVALLALPAVLLFFAWTLLTARRGEKRGAACGRRAVALSGAALAGALLSAALLAHAPRAAAGDPAAFIVFPHQLLSPRWGIGAPAPGPDDAISFDLGLAPTTLTLAAVVLAFWQREGRHAALRLSRRRRAALGFFATLALIATLLTLPPTLPFWSALPGAAALELPWRLLGVAALALAAAGGACGLLSFGRPAGQVALVTFIGVAILAVFPYLQTPEGIFRPPPPGAPLR